MIKSFYMPKHCYYNLYIWLKQVSFCQTETTSHLIKFMFPVFINSSSYDNFNSYLYQIRHGCCCGQCVFIFFFNLDKSYYWLNNSLSIHENSAIQNIALLLLHVNYNSSKQKFCGQRYYISNTKNVVLCKIFQ